MYTNVVAVVYNKDLSPEVEDIKRFGAAATKLVELLKQNNAHIVAFFFNYKKSLDVKIIYITFEVFSAC